MVPYVELASRFATDLNALIDPGKRVGIAVSGGPDSLALLLLAAAARPGKIEAATVDHCLRPESRAEATKVGEICDRLGVSHRILTAEWTKPPTTGLQQRSRTERYRLLGRWLTEQGLDALATAHHLDDQAETLIMRLNRGSGARGLAGIRPSAKVPGSEHALLRPLLQWRRGELEAICSAAGLQPVADPSNADDRFERVRIRRALRTADWLDPHGLGRSAAYLASADEALDWGADAVWQSSVSRVGGRLVFQPAGVPLELRRRIVGKAVAELETEAPGTPLRGSALDGLMSALERGGIATLRGVKCRGGDDWHFETAPSRTRRVSNLR